MAEIISFLDEPRVVNATRATCSAAFLVDTSDERDSQVIAKMFILAAPCTIGNAINEQAFRDDTCSEISEEQGEDNMMIMTHKRADGHLKSHCSVPEVRWRSALAKALFSHGLQGAGNQESLCCPPK